MNNELIKICIEHGYVPPDCILDSLLVLLLVKDGKNPCVGCRADCKHRIESRENFYERNGLTAEKVEFNKRVQKREELGTSKEVIMFVDTDRDIISIRVMNPGTERCYITRSKSCPEASHLIPIIAREYKVRQIFVEINGCGMAVIDHLRNVDVKDLDIIPMMCMQSSISKSMKFMEGRL